MSLRVFYLFIKLLTVKNNVLYMSFNAIKCIKRLKLGSSTDFIESFKFFEAI